MKADQLIARSFSFYVLLLVWILPAATAVGQQAVKDAGLWTSLSVEKKFSDRISCSVSEELRFNENLSALGSFFTDAGVNYKLSDKLKIALNYRFINKRQLDNSYSVRHRFYVDLSYRQKLQDLSIVFRGRLQEQQQDIWSSDDGRIPVWYLRPKLAFKYNLPGPWSPGLSAELFYSMTDAQWDNLRMAVQAERKLNSNWDLNLFLMHQREIGVEEPVWDYIAGFGFTHSI